MKTKKYLLFLLAAPAIILMTSMAGCPSGVGYDIEDAPIHEVDVSFAESFPVQVFVHINGGLPDSCASFNNIETTRQGDTINIRVTIKRAGETACVQVYRFFDKNINIGSDFLTGQSYTIIVNDFESVTFTMP